MRKKRKSGRGAKSCAGATPSKGRLKGGGFNAQLLIKIKQKIHSGSIVVTDTKLKKKSANKSNC